VLSTFLTLLINFDVQTTRGLDQISNWVSANLASDPGGYRWPPPFPAGSKQLFGNFGNLLFLAVFQVLNFRSRFEALNDVFLGMLRLQNFIMKIL
jgi:hypothetical protein